MHACFPEDESIRVKHVPLIHGHHQHHYLHCEQAYLAPTRVVFIVNTSRSTKIHLEGTFWFFL